MTTENIDKGRADYQSREEQHWAELQNILRDGKISLSEALINFPAFVRRREMTRLLADYDLFRMIQDLPGSVVELGVFLGAGLFTWSKLLETFVPGDRSRKVYGFESGGGYQDFASEDGDPRPWIENVVGRKVVPDGYLDRMVKLTNQDNLLPGIERCRIISGNILETVPAFAASNQGTRLSMIFFDVNLYKPTLAGFRALYPLLLPGGVVAMNGFGSPPWLGETAAFENYFKEIGCRLPHVRKLPYSIRPGGYFIKE
jgi:hypothetical protein